MAVAVVVFVFRWALPGGTGFVGAARGGKSLGSSSPGGTDEAAGVLSLETDIPAKGVSGKSAVVFLLRLLMAVGISLEREGI